MLRTRLLTSDMLRRPSGPGEKVLTSSSRVVICIVPVSWISIPCRISKEDSRVVHQYMHDHRRAWRLRSTSPRAKLKYNVADDGGPPGSSRECKSDSSAKSLLYVSDILPLQGGTLTNPCIQLLPPESEGMHWVLTHGQNHLHPCL